jgi:hypothetical protein
MELLEQLETIQTQRDLVHFIRALLTDFEVNTSSWQNQDIGSYFEALCAWIEDRDSNLNAIGEAKPVVPSWKLFGAMLIAAKYYE